MPNQHMNMRSSDQRLTDESQYHAKGTFEKMKNTFESQEMRFIWVIHKKEGLLME